MVQILALYIDASDLGQAIDLLLPVLGGVIIKQNQVAAVKLTDKAREALSNMARQKI